MRRAAVAVAALALLGLAPGCGRDEAPPPSPGTMVERYYAAGQDPKARCATLSARSLSRFGGPEGCAKRVVPSRAKPAPARAEDTKIQGDQACTRFQVRGAGKGIAVLVREPDGWRIDRWDSGLEPTMPAALPCELPREKPD